MRKQVNPMTRREKLHRKTKYLAANIHIVQCGPKTISTFHSTLWDLCIVMTNQTTSGLERQIRPFLGPYLDIGPERDQVPISGLQRKHWIQASICKKNLQFNYVDQAILRRLVPSCFHQTGDKCPLHSLPKQSQLVLCSGLASFKSSMCQLQMWGQIWLLQKSLVC